MSDMEYWRWSEELSVFQASLLSVGVDPSSETGSCCEECKVHERPHGYEAAKTGISNALMNGKVKGKLIPEYYYDINGNPCGDVDESVNIQDSLVDVASLKEWMVLRGLMPLFFFPTATEAPGYLDPANPRYAPKLAAAVRAWQAVTEPGKKSAKQAIEEWLRENAAQFGLVAGNGTPVNQAIEDCSKVANWNPTGGAPKTPGG